MSATTSLQSEATNTWDSERSRARERASLHAKASSVARSLIPVCLTADAPRYLPMSSLLNWFLLNQEHMHVWYLIHVSTKAHIVLTSPIQIRNIITHIVLTSHVHTYVNLAIEANPIGSSSSGGGALSSTSGDVLSSSSAGDVLSSVYGDRCPTTKPYVHLWCFLPS